jgi:hypothetical protein
VVAYAAAALAGAAGEELAGSAAARETAVARVRPPAVTIAILRERLADAKERLADAKERLMDRKEGRGKCLAKRKPLLARAVRDRLPPLTPRSARWGEARQASARGLDAGTGRRAARCRLGLAGEVLLSANDGIEQSITAPAFQRFRWYERRVASVRRAKHRARREFLLPAGNFCELGHVVLLAQPFSQ